MHRLCFTHNHCGRHNPPQRCVTCGPQNSHFALVAELVDAPDLGSGVSRRVGSSPIRRTQKTPDSNSQLSGVLFLHHTYINTHARETSVHTSTRFPMARKNGACGDTYPACAVCLSYRRTTEANYFTSPTFIRYSAICTALSAAPLRIWSPLSHSVRPQSSARSLRTRPTYTSSRPAVSSGIG